MGGYREVKIEEGRPTVDMAIKRLTYELNLAGRTGISAIKLIHGYGSSGTGGRLRVELRKYLERQKKFGKISGIITGENFSIFDRDTLSAFASCGELRADRDLDRHNNGITIVIL